MILPNPCMYVLCMYVCMYVCMCVCVCFCIFASTYFSDIFFDYTSCLFFTIITVYDSYVESIRVDDLNKTIYVI
jgi:hypothetical protein